MFLSAHQVRVRYAETDQMGYVYYGRYADFYEVGRTEMIRKLGFTYPEFEEAGIMMPVREIKIRYFKPARYDDLLTIKTSLKTLPGARITFHYEVFNEQAKLLNTGEVTLVFIGDQSRRPVRAPEKLLQALQPFFT